MPRPLGRQFMEHETTFLQLVYRTSATELRCLKGFSSRIWCKCLRLRVGAVSAMDFLCDPLVERLWLHKDNIHWVLYKTAHLEENIGAGDEPWDSGRADEWLHIAPRTTLSLGDDQYASESGKTESGSTEQEAICAVEQRRAEAVVLSSLIARVRMATPAVRTRLLAWLHGGASAVTAPNR